LRHFRTARVSALERWHNGYKNGGQQRSLKTEAEARIGVDA